MPRAGEAMAIEQRQKIALARRRGQRDGTETHEDGTVSIPVTRVGCALVDAEDADLADYHWCGSAYGYATRGGERYAGGRKPVLLMHRIVLERKLGRPIADGMEPDHINGNRLDNRRANLREVCRSQNMRNRQKTWAVNGRATTSRFKGVHWRTDRNKWQASIGGGRQTTNLGMYEDEVEAARAYDAAARARYGEYARVNFPDE